ncbi:hypothetical protein CIRG_00805 [Coccidioides immitis RMSCC 2394]|uniref:Uncharacterized protein n=1 Tax=Coccidioides immitis RMSCC 2394 TaxID=404692 RepID=A0A0J6Y207_COCIT|nr:hypothetical protein CIRG_00805 [Coccidioides immitis RMSCC 2394]
MVPSDHRGRSLHMSQYIASGLAVAASTCWISNNLIQDGLMIDVIETRCRCGWLGPSFYPLSVHSHIVRSAFIESSLALTARSENILSRFPSTAPNAGLASKSLDPASYTHMRTPVLAASRVPSTTVMCDIIHNRSYHLRSSASSPVLSGDYRSRPWNIQLKQPMYGLGIPNERKGIFTKRKLQAEGGFPYCELYRHMLGNSFGSGLYVEEPGYRLHRKQHASNPPELGNL